MKRTLILTAIVTGLCISAPTVTHADAVSVAERYLGTNPTKMSRAWCANFMNMIERKVGRPGTGSNLAASFLRSKYYTRISQSQLKRGDIVYNGRRGGGHVSYFIKWTTCKNGKGKCAYTISGNTSRRVKYAVRDPKTLVALRAKGGSGTLVAKSKSKKVKLRYIADRSSLNRRG
jgi:uncharacterized protein (TIGR02594 family)